MMQDQIRNTLAAMLDAKEREAEDARLEARNVLDRLQEPGSEKPVEKVDPVKRARELDQLEHDLASKTEFAAGVRNVCAYLRAELLGLPVADEGQAPRAR